MKSVKQVLVFFCALFLFYGLNSCDAINNEKLELEIDWTNEDALLSTKHLKKEETVSFPLKNINIKFFEKIHSNVLQRAYILEEEKVKNGSPRRDVDDDNSTEDDYEDENGDEGDDRIISTDISEDSFVSTERKVFQKILKNKQRTYYYTVYTFNFDLEKLDAQALNAVFMALGSMPEYLNMLSPDSNNNNNKNDNKPWLLQTTGDDNKIVPPPSNDEADNGYGSYYSSFSAVELMEDDKSNKKMTMTVYIMKALQTIDYLINYLVISAGHKNEAKEAVQQLHEEREYLYKLKELANGNASTDNPIWKNKANHEKFYMYKALYNIQKVYENLRHQTGSGAPTKKSDTYYAQVINLVTKSLTCGDILNTATVLDIVILDNLSKHANWKPKFSLKEYNESMKNCKTLLEVTLDMKDLERSVPSSEFHDFVDKLRVKKAVPEQYVPELEEDYSDKILKKYQDEKKESNNSSDKVIIDNGTNYAEGEVTSADQEYASIYDNDRVLYETKIDSGVNSYLQKESDEEDALISDIIKEESKDVESLLELSRTKSLRFLLDDADNDNNDDDDVDDIDTMLTSDDANENEELEDEDDDDFDFSEYLKKEALAGLNNIRLNIADAAKKTGKKIATATAKKGEKVFKNAIKKGKGGLKNVVNKMSEKTGLNFDMDTKKNKGITKKSKSGMNKKVNGLNSYDKSNNLKSKKSSLRNKRGKANGTFISLNAEAEKMLKNEDEIKEELKQINIAYRALDDEKNKLQNMMIEPTDDSDKEIFEQFENYENSIEENKA